MERTGDALAQFNLDLMYKHGDGVPKDETEAAHLIVDAAARKTFNTGMKRILIALLLLTLAAPAWGQDYEKGMQAYDRGDYAIPDERVAEASNRNTEPLFNRIVANIHENRTVAELRNALLPKLMSGEIRVREGEKKVERIVGRCV